MPRSSVALRLLAAGTVAAVGTLTVGASAAPVQARTRPGAIAAAAATAQHRFGVPASLLEAICYLEGHLSDHGGAPSSDGGYGCMDLARNRHMDTLGQAAGLVGAPVSSVRRNLSLNSLHHPTAPSHPPKTAKCSHRQIRPTRRAVRPCSRSRDRRLEPGPHCLVLRLRVFRRLGALATLCPRG